MDIESSYMYRIIKRLMTRNIMSPMDSVLVVCGGDFDEAVLGLLNFEHVLCTNIDPGQLSEENPVVQDVRSLSFPDFTFDCVVVHASLHNVDPLTRLSARCTEWRERPYFSLKRRTLS